MRIIRKLSWLVIGQVVLLLALASGAAQARTVVYVDDDGAQCATPYRTIQAGVDSLGPAPSGATIIVCPGTYAGRVSISDASDLLVSGRPGALLIPDSKVFTGSLVLVAKSRGVIIQGLTIDGVRGLAADTGYNYAINYTASSGRISGNSIVRWRPSSLTDPVFPNGESSIYVQTASGSPLKIQIDRNRVSDYAWSAITEIGPIRSTITRNTIQGSGDAYTLPIAIQIDENDRGGRITDNTITSDDPLPPTSGGGTGIELSNASFFTVSHNLIRKVSASIRISAACLSGPGASHNRVDSNQLLDTAVGVQIIATATSGCDSHADDNRVTNNQIVDHEGLGARAVVIHAIDDDTTLPPVSSATGEVVTHNVIRHFTRPVVIYTGEGGTVSGTFTPNTILP